MALSYDDLIKDSHFDNLKGKYFLKIFSVKFLKL